MEKGNFCTYSKVPMVRLSKETMIFKISFICLFVFPDSYLWSQVPLLW